MPSWPVVTHKGHSEHGANCVRRSFLSIGFVYDEMLLLGLLGNSTMTLYLASLSFLLLGWALMLMNRRDGVTDPSTPALDEKGTSSHRPLP
jgi:hypothetical protein